MSDFTFQVDLKGMIRLLSENLYSNDSVFLRELLQNAIDAIEARRGEEPEFDAGLIEVRLFKNGILEFSDNGIGLTDSDIHMFLSVIGKSSKRDNVRQQGFIGQFGIGLLSCFLVADDIEVLTYSPKSESAYRWIGKSDGVYTVKEEPDYKKQGTTVRLQMTKSMREKYDIDNIKLNLEEYGFLVPTPIYLETEGERERINDTYIPFRDEFYTKSQLLDFGELIFDRMFLDVIPINTDSIQGCIFFSSMPATSTTTQRHKVYLKNMLITDDGKDIVPKWAFFAQCFINCTDLTPTASRESFYRDQKLSAARGQIERAIIEHLMALTEVDPRQLQAIINLHNVAIKSLVSENERVFKLLFPFLTFSTNAGALTGDQLLQVAKKSTVYFCTSVDEFRKIRPLLEDKRTVLINAGYIYDTEIIKRTMRANKALKFKELSDEIIGDVLQLPSEEQEEQLSELVQEAVIALRPLNCTAMLRQFSPVELASLFVTGVITYAGTGGTSNDDDDDIFLSEDLFSDDEEDMDGEMFISNCLYINANSPLIAKIAKIKDKEMLHMLCEVIYLQAHMQGGHPLDSSKMRLLNENLTKLIELGLE